MTVPGHVYRTASHAMLDAGWSVRNPVIRYNEPSPGAVVTVARIAVPALGHELPDAIGLHLAYYHKGEPVLPPEVCSAEVRQWTGEDWHGAVLREAPSCAVAHWRSYLAASHAMLDAGWSVRNPVVHYGEPGPGAVVTVARIAAPALSPVVAGATALHLTYFRAGRQRVPPHALVAELREWTGTTWDCWPGPTYASTWMSSTIAHELLLLVDEMMFLAKDALVEAEGQHDIFAANEHRRQVRAICRRFAHLVDDAYGTLTEVALERGAHSEHVAEMGPAGELVALAQEVALVARQGISPAAEGERCLAKELWCDANMAANTLRHLIAASPVLNQPSDY